MFMDDAVVDIVVFAFVEMFPFFFYVMRLSSHFSLNF